MDVKNLDSNKKSPPSTADEAELHLKICGPSKNGDGNWCCQDSRWPKLWAVLQNYDKDVVVEIMADMLSTIRGFSEAVQLPVKRLPPRARLPFLLFMVSRLSLIHTPIIYSHRRRNFIFSKRRNTNSFLIKIRKTAKIAHPECDCHSI